MKKSGYDLDSGFYLDVTTGRLYEPKLYCEICGINHYNARLDVHHYLPQGKCLRDVKSKDPKPCHWSQEFINENQKLFTVCRQCHDAIHARGRKKVINGRDLRNYLYVEEKPEVVTKPKAFVVHKRG